MATVRFTANLRRHVACPDVTVEAATVRDALARACADRPELLAYVLDEQGGLRKHVTVFVNGVPVLDRAALSDRVGPDDAIDVMQALSGG